MRQTIRLYVTTRSDPVPDLDEMKTAAELAKWKVDIRKHALEIKEYQEIEDRIIEDMEKLVIKECYAVIAYPTGRITEASMQVGNAILKFLKKNADRLNWELDESGLSAETPEEIAQRYKFGGKKAPKIIDPNKLWENFTYGLIKDSSLNGDEYEVDLEVVVKE